MADAAAAVAVAERGSLRCNYCYYIQVIQTHTHCDRVQVRSVCFASELIWSAVWQFAMRLNKATLIDPQNRIEIGIGIEAALIRQSRFYGRQIYRVRSPDA